MTIVTPAPARHQPNGGRALTVRFAGNSGDGVQLAGLHERRGPRRRPYDTAGISGRLVHGEPMLFGTERDRGLVFDDGVCRFRVVEIARDCEASAVAVHDETSLARAFALAGLERPGVPIPIGVLYARPGQADSCGFAERPEAEPMTRDDLAAMLEAGQRR